MVFQQAYFALGFVRKCFQRRGAIEGIVSEGGTPFNRVVAL